MKVMSSSNTISNLTRVQRESGFTLLEVTVAVALLGAALTVIVGLQTRLVDTMVQERNLFKASLYAQYLLTFLDVDQTPPEAGTTNGSLEDELQKRGYFDDEMPLDVKRELQTWRFSQQVQSIDFGDFKDVLRRISLKIEWGTGSAEQSEYLYYMVSDPTGQRLQQASALTGGSGR